MKSARIEAFISKIIANSDKSLAIKQLSSWMTKNLKLDGRPYSFKKHEAHIAIAKDTHPHQTVKKCSQVGLTELALRLVAAISAVSRSRLIYILPSARFSEKVSTDRFLPIIMGSPILRALIHAEAKSSSMRKLGDSTVYFQGASGTSQAISIPATHLIIDEENFCDPTILGQFNSRLRHADTDPETGIKGSTRRFSTPTIPKYGVSKHYLESDQKSYYVKCEHCNTTQLPSYYNDYVIPNYDDKIALFTAQDLANKAYKVRDAYVKCQKCGKDLWNSLMNPDLRMWVAKYPDNREISGYSMAPIDVPFYNPVSSIFTQLKGYTIQDHRNFVLGLDHEDSHNSFMESVFQQSETSTIIPLHTLKTSSQTLSNVRIGVDIGKTSHIIVGQRRGTKMYILNVTTISMRSGTPLHKLIQEFIDAYTPDCLVLDAAPDFSTPQALLENNTYGKVFGCEYKRSTQKVYSNTEAKEDLGIVKADRSGTLSDLMGEHNEGRIIYPSLEHEQVEHLKDHLSVTKKVTLASEFGDIISFPKPSDPDHYAHALNYMMIADSLVEGGGLGDTGIIGVLPDIKTIRLGSNVDKISSNPLLLPDMFYRR